MTPRRVVIQDVEPSTLDRVSASKGVLGKPVAVAATVYADGHDVVDAHVRWRKTGGRWAVAPMVPVGNDRFEGTIVPSRIGAHEFRVEGWVDELGTWQERIRRRLAAGMDIADELDTGAGLIGQPVLDVAAALEKRNPPPDVTTASGPWRLWVDRARAAVGAWYELFPRSHGGFAGAAKRLAAVAEMGFDVVYLPPIHPIGTTARKGKGNTLVAGPNDPGSPWAIGSPLGGHDAIDPGLGTVADFADFVAEAARLGMEVALDYALQCSPDHPWVHAHPEWFSRRPDGTIRFAENPPKQYQDVYPIDMLPDRDEDRVALWEACRDVVDRWIDRGVLIFRVDNPHTKPFAFWSWLIDDVRSRHPDVVFLAEAFTRPAVMHRLAEIGFSQSYTYFTWRNTKQELTEYGEELARGPAASYFRPNLWPNTPDILSGVLRGGPPAAFKLRAALAATIGPSWGVYSGYELAENVPASDANEEYADSEKYELKRRDFDSPDSIAWFLGRLNRARREHPALADLASLRFHYTTNDAIIAYTKQAGDDVVLTVVSLDPYGAQDAGLWIDLGALELPWDGPLAAVDEITGREFRWGGPEPYVRLDPYAPAHVIHLRVAP